MTNRKFDAFGLPPIFAYLMLLIVFISLSNYLFSSTEFAVYNYMILVFVLALKLTEKKRNDFLRICFNTKDYFKVRCLENSLVVLPFVIYLVVEKMYMWALVFFLVLNLLVLVKIKMETNFTIPTPFGKRPFEFSSGFRGTFFVFPIAYLLTCIAVSVNNFNLGVFSILLIFIITISYYVKLEKEMYVWSFSQTSKAFLITKIKTALLFSTILCLPILIVLIVFFTSELETVLTFLLLGYIYLATIILAKYSTYPYEMSIPQGVLVAISLLFPPLLLGLIPYFYLQSIKRLNVILE